MKYIRDVSAGAMAPGNVVDVVHGADYTVAGLSGVDISPDGQFAFFSKNPDHTAKAIDAWVTQVGTPNQCALEPAQKVLFPSHNVKFLPNSELVFYGDNFNEMDGTIEGWVAVTEGCRGKKKFADKLEAFWVRDNHFVLYSEQTANPDRAVSLRYAQIESGKGWPATTTLVTDDVGGGYSLVPGFQGVVFFCS